jgi:hypothetical protein
MASITSTKGDAERLEKLALAITGNGNAAAPMPTTGPTVATDDVVARVEAAAELVREAGRYASDHGQYLDEISAAFAEKLRAMTSEYARNLLAAEERKMAELRKIMGKLAG